MATIFKICGIRDAAAATVAAESGADFLGFVFVEGVRRQLSPERGAEAIAEFRSALAPDSTSNGGDDSSKIPKIVGLFANQPADFVNRAARSCGLERAQLCGDEPPDFWEALDLPVIRQVKVREELGREGAAALAARQAAEALEAGHLAILDKHRRGALGGTGETFDWTLAAQIGASVGVSGGADGGASCDGLILAGGLTPENVSDAIAAASPWGVDVSSGVETGGVKDHAKIRRFARAVRGGGR